jgi:hypothetical protein
MKVSDVKHRPVPNQFIGDHEQHCVHVLLYLFVFLYNGAFISSDGTAPNFSVNGEPPFQRNLE